MSFLEQLVQNGVIKENQLTEIVRQAKEKYDGYTDRALVDFGVTEPQILALKSQYLFRCLEVYSRGLGEAL